MSDDTLSVTFTFDTEFATADIWVDEQFTNSYGDERAVLAGDTYEYKETIKFDWETTHHTFDDGRKAWIVDVDALSELEERLEEAGATVDLDAVEPGDVAPDEDLAALADTAAEGDHVRVTYRKKTGNGTGEYAGVVDRVYTDRDRPRVAFHRDDDGHRMWLKPDQHGNAALFTANSHAPFVGALEAVTLTVDDEEDDTEEEDDGRQLASWGVYDWTDGAMCACPERGNEPRPFEIDVGHDFDGELACENCGGFIR